MAKHSYKIIFNDECAMINGLTYSFGGTKNIHLYLIKGKAVVTFEMSVLKSFDDFTDMKVPVFNDVYRKVILCHACKYGTDINVKNITICIDDDRKMLNKDNTDAFPLVYSMIPTYKFEIGKKFSEKDFLQKIVSSTKSDAENDLRFVALYSFIQSKGRGYRIDRFTNLWSAVNAVYNFEYHKTSAYQKNKQDKDSDAINNYIQSVLKFERIRPTRKVKEKNIKLYHETQRLISHIKESDMESIYEKLSNKKKLNDYEEKVTARLSEIASNLGMDLFPFLLFEFPYHLRCDYFHGNHCTTLISSYKDYEINCLRNINYILDGFLDKAITEMFEEEN